MVEEAHAVLCGSFEWVLNEKRIVERADLGTMHAMLLDVPREPRALLGWVSSVEAALESS